MIKSIAAASVVLLSMLVPSQVNALVAPEESPPQSYEYYCYSGGKVIFSGVAAYTISDLADACRRHNGNLFTRPVES